MGRMLHHAIVVTSLDREAIEKAHRLAADMIPDISPLSDGRNTPNGCRSFCVLPDGSKEGWPESDAGDRNRADLIAWMDAQRYDDGSCSLAWVAVSFGGEESAPAEIEAHSNERKRSAAAQGNGR